jgi:hypothetical protein
MQTGEERPLGVRAEITSHFRIPSLGHLQPLLIRKILDIAVLCLRSCSIVSAESDPNLGAKTHPQDEMIGPSPVKLFLREPLLERRRKCRARPEIFFRQRSWGLLTEWLHNLSIQL